MCKLSKKKMHKPIFEWRENKKIFDENKILFITKRDD